MPEGSILLTQDGEIATITLNRPEVHNAFDDELIEKLTRELHLIANDADVRVVVIAARGKSFCAGADLNYMSRMAGFNEEDGGQQTPGPCLFGGFVAPLSDGRTLSAGPLPSAEFEAQPRSAAIYEPPSDSWAEQPGLPGDYTPGLAVGLTDGTALIVAGNGDADGSVGLQFIPPQ